jgi:SAM-dependent methyltransferase
MTYYSNKLETLKDIFGTGAVRLEEEYLVVAGRTYPVINDVIVLTEPWQYTALVREHLHGPALPCAGAATAFAEDIQFSFGEEWKKYDKILPEHEKEFLQYFDIVDLEKLAGKRTCDLGCGMGRWSYYLKDRCKELVLVDFSDAIFAARENLRGADNCLFFMADLKALPFKDNFAGFLFSLGVLHHLPTPCLDEVRALKRFSPELLLFLYYALDNRPFYFRWLLGAVTFIRRAVSKVRSPLFRKLFSLLGTYGIYGPLVFAGRALKPFKLASSVPLYDFYHDKSRQRIEQDVYDRFFTRIEQRVTRSDILTLKDTFSEVIISDQLPYWHFLCKR